MCIRDSLWTVPRPRKLSRCLPMLGKKCQLKHTLTSRAGEEDTHTHTHTVGHLEEEEARLRRPTRADSNPANLSWPQYSTQTPPFTHTCHVRSPAKRSPPLGPHTQIYFWYSRVDFVICLDPTRCVSASSRSRHFIFYFLNFPHPTGSQCLERYEIVFSKIKCQPFHRIVLAG